MFRQLHKQLWFVCLMVFAIGWSSVSIASVNVMQHEQMMNSSLLDEHQSMMKNSAVQEMKQHCADIQQKQNDQNSHLNHEQQLQNLKDCHNQQVQSPDTQQSKCPDCAAFSCQSSVVWFNPDIPKLIAPDHLHNTQAYQINYQAQHLAGHWQEILRPPKA